MKLGYKIILIYLVILLFIIIFLIINKDDEVINKTINNKDKKYSYDIHYPYFSNDTLDKYLKEYIDNSINEITYKENNKELFIDYDYKINKDDISITFYKYLNSNNTLNYASYVINYNSKNNIIKSDYMINKNNCYDFINNRVVISNKPMIAFTFDDGPSYNTSKILNSLLKYNSSATFFIVGNKVNNYPKTLNKLVENGMDLGNHTYSHKLLTRLKEEQILEEINKTNNEIYEITNTKPTYFRPSYGSVSKKIKNISKMPIIIWNLDTMDWKNHNSKKIANKILKYASDGDIILMHDTYSATANAVEMVLPKLIEKGFQIVSVKELFYYKGITPKLGYAYGSVN